MPDDRVTSDYLPNPAGAVHGPLWLTHDDNEEFLSSPMRKNEKVDPVFGTSEDPTTYGGSDH